MARETSRHLAPAVQPSGMQEQGILGGIPRPINGGNVGTPREGNALALLALLLADGDHLERIVHVRAVVVLGLEHPLACSLIQATDECHLRDASRQAGRQ